VNYLAFLILGLGNGAAFAALALALVIAFRSSGIVNFSTGAVALYTAYTYSYLVDGELLVPIPGLPVSVHLADTLPQAVALVGSLLIAAALNMLLYFLVFRRLRQAPAVAKAVASIGVLLTIQGLLAQRVGTSPVAVGPIFPTGHFSISGNTIPEAMVWFAGTILVVAFLLAAMYQRTPFGLRTRAVCETERGAIVSGLSPVRIALANWAISGAVAGLGGVLIAPLIPLVPDAYTLLVVPALAAALAAGFTSLTGAVLLALGMGMLQSLLGFLQSEHSWLPQQGPSEIVTFGVILAFLLLNGHGLPSRGSITLRTLGDAPRPRSPRVAALIGAAAVLVALVATSGNARAALTITIIYSILALSLVVVTGFAGQVSFAQLALAGVSAFTLSRLEAGLHVPFPWSPLIAASIAALVGVLIGFPALRLRGLSVAVFTLAISVVLDAAWFGNLDYTGGTGGAQVVPPSLLGIDLSVGSGLAFPRLEFGVLCVVVLVATGLFVAWLRRSRYGAAMLAVRANERSAAASGVNVVRTKLLAFGIGAFIAGLAGALLAYETTFAAPATFSTFAGLGFFAMVYLSGITSIAGGLQAGLFAVGGVTYTIFNNTISIGGWYAVLSGLGLIWVTIAQPEGCIAAFHALADRLAALGWGRRHGAQGARVVSEAPVPRRSSTTAADSNRRRRGGSPVLRVEDVSVRYGGVTALDGVSFEIGEGRLVGLIGPNGAGKTTLLDVVSGFTPTNGTVLVDGSALGSRKPYERARLGLGRTFQGIDLYDDLTAAENMIVGQEAARYQRDAEKPEAPAVGSSSLEELCAMLGLEEVMERRARELSTGQRQLVSIGRVLAGRPRLVLLDEPAAGLDPQESRWLGERLRVVRDSGITIVLIDHDMELVLSVCDEVHVLDLGKLIASGSAEDIRADERVAAAYLGSPHGERPMTASER
jgi:ABC-type branched-subunit amino acid transport system ATPase component/ABC-type branched-subunit amino acid transport system permease subunit